MGGASVMRRWYPLARRPRGDADRQSVRPGPGVRDRTVRRPGRTAAGRRVGPPVGSNPERRRPLVMAGEGRGEAATPCWARGSRAGPVQRSPCRAAACRQGVRPEPRLERRGIRHRRVNSPTARSVSTVAQPSPMTGSPRRSAEVAAASGRSPRPESNDPARLIRPAAGPARANRGFEADPSIEPDRRVVVGEDPERHTAAPRPHPVQGGCRGYEARKAPATRRGHGSDRREVGQPVEGRAAGDGGGHARASGRRSG